MKTEHMSITLAGRNLHTWTRYSGVDPEASYDGQANLQQEFQTQPNPTYYTLRLNFGF